MIIATAVGRLGRDSELRTTQSGMDVCSFTVACDRGYGDKKTTEWVKCILFDKRARALQPYLVKGLAVTVMGEAKAAFWSKDGEANGQIEIIADKVTMQSKSERTNDSGGGETPQNDAGAQGGDLDDEIPF